MNILAELFKETGDGDRVARAKLVSKHWGNERWLVPEDSPYAFKVITVLAGRRTSLQYHRRKDETNLIISGCGLLHSGTPLTAREVGPGDVARVRPGTVHRVEAITDLVIVEVSTPELDDVVRLEDDHGRGDGRIEAEHH